VNIEAAASETIVQEGTSGTEGEGLGVADVDGVGEGVGVGVFVGVVVGVDEVVGVCWGVGVGVGVDVGVGEGVGLGLGFGHCGSCTVTPSMSKGATSG
jgi:hypothetical protein